ncbi:MAG: hypothetical protein FWE46_05595 [Coriobacteriia bacterium]|nr:hypothetical protein [Coriobacteriia bacterium]MCL2537092.1 hypothetical protein [Coriobacteriia bacterium]
MARKKSKLPVESTDAKKTNFKKFGIIGGVAAIVVAGIALVLFTPVGTHLDVITESVGIKQAPREFVQDFELGFKVADADLGDLPEMIQPPVFTFEKTLDESYDPEKRGYRDAEVRDPVGMSASRVTVDFARQMQEKQILDLSIESSNTLSGNLFDPGQFQVFMVQNPVFADGSMLIMPESMDFALQALVDSSAEPTVTVTNQLKHVTVDVMNGPQLWIAEKALREAGNADTANSIVAKMANTTGGDDCGSAKPSNWNENIFNTNQGLTWHDGETKTEQVLVSPARTETRTRTVPGPSRTEWVRRCGCGFVARASNPNQLQNIVNRHLDRLPSDSEGNISWGRCATGEMNPRQVTIAGPSTTETYTVDIPAEYRTDITVISEPGWR